MQVDFYILKGKNKQNAWRFACDLLEKWHEAETIFVLMNHLEEAKQFDQLLWTYQEESFIPHQLTNESLAGLPLKLQIGFDLPITNCTKILNLSTKTVDIHHPHLIEIVYNDPDIENEARARYKFYRNQHCQLQTYKM